MTNIKSNTKKKKENLDVMFRVRVSKAIERSICSTAYYHNMNVSQWFRKIIEQNIIKPGDTLPSQNNG